MFNTKHTCVFKLYEWVIRQKTRNPRGANQICVFQMRDKQIRLCGPPDANLACSGSTEGTFSAPVMANPSKVGRYFWYFGQKYSEKWRFP